MHPQVCWAAHCLPGGRSQGGLLAHVLFPVPGDGICYLWSRAVLCLDTQSCPNLCNPMDCSLPGPSVHGILQARILEWIAYPFSR